MLTAKFLARQRRHATTNDFPEIFRKKTGNSGKSKSAQNHLKYVLDPKKKFSPSGQNVPWNLVSASPITSQRLSPHPEGPKNFFGPKYFLDHFEQFLKICHFFVNFVQNLAPNPFTLASGADAKIMHL